MVEQSATTVDRVFHALSHPARREMLQRLAAGERTVGELAEPLAMSFAGASKHVQVLERSGLVHRSIRGRHHVCRLAPQPLREASEWLRFYEPFWTANLDALEAMFREEVE